MARALRAFGVTLPLVVALIASGCAAFGSRDTGTMCPAPSLEPTTTPAAAGSAVTYGLLVDRAYTGDAKRSPSYPWPQLPKTALDTFAATLTKLDLRPGDSVFGAWISHNSNDTREIFLPLTQVPRTAIADLPPAPTQPKPPLNQLDCNDYAAKVRAYNAAAKDWQAKVNDIAQRAADTDAKAVATFIEKTQAALRSIAPVQDPVGTDIYGGLAVAGGVFKANAGKHKLAIFSDMTDTVGNAVRPDLGQSDVVVGLYHRDDPSDQGKGQRDWEATFKTLGATTPVFLPWAATTPDKIAELLRASAR